MPKAIGLKKSLLLSPFGVNALGTYNPGFTVNNLTRILSKVKQKAEEQRPSASNKLVQIFIFSGDNIDPY